MQATLKTLAALSLVLATACGHDDGHDHGNENEVITTVVLTFTPDSGGSALVFEFDDPDGDGGGAPTIDAIDLAEGGYSLAVRLENRLEDPAEDITEEVSDESAEHQLFFIGTAVDGPAAMNAGAPLSHAYDDQDTNGLPIGLANSIDATAGAGDLIVVLRHLPPVGGEAVKTASVAQEVRAGGFSSIGGSSDAQVTFPVTVQ